MAAREAELDFQAFLVYPLKEAGSLVVIHLETSPDDRIGFVFEDNIWHGTSSSNL